MMRVTLLQCAMILGIDGLALVCVLRAHWLKRRQESSEAQIYCYEQIKLLLIILWTFLPIPADDAPNLPFRAYRYFQLHRATSAPPFRPALICPQDPSKSQRANDETVRAATTRHRRAVHPISPSHAQERVVRCSGRDTLGLAPPEPAPEGARQRLL